MVDTSSVAVHVLDADSCVAVGSDGSRWRIGAGLAALRTAEGTVVLDDLRSHGADAVPPPVHRADVVLPCAADLETWFDAARDHDERADGPSVELLPSTVVLPFAGRWYRVRMTSHSGAATAALLLDCLRSTVPEPDLADALLRSPDLVSGAWLPRAPSTAREDARQESPPPGTVARWDGDAWSLHPLDPAPLVDDVSGILRRIVARPADPVLPAGFRHLHAELPYLSSIDPTYQPDLLAPAGALDDGLRSVVELDEPALLSGVAHYCGAYLGQGVLRRASPRELRSEGVRTTSVADWGPHDPSLHRAPGFPFVLADDDALTWWLAGDETGARCWVPLSLVHAGYLQSALPGLTPTNTHNLVGLAAGRTVEEATESACAHVVSHDALAVWWSSDHVARPAPVPRRVIAAWGDCELQLHILDIPSTTGVPVRLAVVDDRRSDIVSLGHAAAADPTTAAELAVVEALVQHATARDLVGESSLVRDAERLGNGGVAGLAPYDPARRYASAFGAGFRGLVDPMAHVQLGLDLEIAAMTRRRTTPARQGGSTGVSNRSARASLERAGHRVVRVDVSTQRVRSAGMHAVRVVVPGLARLQPAAFPLSPDGRLAGARQVLGWGTCAEPSPYPGW